jgi:flagellin
MALRINTNISALNSHANLQKSDASLSKSLERLSSGLRINRSADDAAGMSIANMLKSQSLGLGQAIRNANDGISIVQIADAALDESINILNTIKQKAVQAAQDGQTLESRKAIQADINKLLKEMNDIAQTTAFNGMKLLSGNFINKQFQVGAYSGQTVDINIASAETTKIGHVTTADLQLTNSTGGEVRLGIYSALRDATVQIQSVNLAYDNTKEHSMGALAAAINLNSDLTGVTAQAFVSSTSNSAVKAGTTGTDFAINGVTIGAVSVQDNDATGSLVNAINQKSSEHGVTASVDAQGYLKLTSNDGRAIKVTGDTGTTLVGSNLNTFGYIRLFQMGANDIKITDATDMVSLNLTGNLTLDAAMSTTVDSTLVKGSVIATGSVIRAGSTLGATLGTGGFIGRVTTTQDSELKAGSIIGSDSVIKQGTILGGSANNSGAVTTSTDSLLKTGSILTADTVLAAGTTVTTDIVTSVGTVTAGTTLASDYTTAGSNTLLNDMVVKANSTFQSGSTFFTGSYVGANVTLSGASTLTVGMTLKAGSTITTGTSILEGSTIGGDFTTSTSLTMTSDMILKAGANIVTASSLAKGSTIGGLANTNGDVTLASDMTLAAGSILAAGTTIKKGTVLTDEIVAAGGIHYQAGTVLTGDIVTSGNNVLDASMTLKAGSVVKTGSTFAATATSSSGATASTALSNVQKSRLSDIDVTSQEGAQKGISIVEAAIVAINKVKADLGSVQNQLTSTAANLTTTQLNVTSAESQIRDVDFAEESSNFSKMQILMQAGTFAMAQANASSQNVMRLLQ